MPDIFSVFHRQKAGTVSDGPGGVQLVLVIRQIWTRIEALSGPVGYVHGMARGHMHALLAGVAELFKETLGLK